MISSTIVYHIDNNNDQVYSERKWAGLSPQVKELIQLVTLSNDTRPVGSFKYKIHKYPSDIDIFEKFTVCCNWKTAVQTIVKSLQELVSELNNHPLLFWGDFKAGIDTRFYAPTKSLNSPKDCKRYIKNVHSLLTTNERETLLEQSQFPEQFAESVRKLYTVRWNQSEILNGLKLLRNGVELKLEDAISQDTVVKLDIWAPIDGNYNEITNFFLFEVVNQKGENYTLNGELGDRKESLLNDIIHYSSPEHYKPLKFAKRLWNWSIITKDKELSYLLAPLFGSGMSHMNQIIGEIEVLVNMIKKYELANLPVDIIVKQLNRFKNRLNEISDVQFDDEMFFNVIDNIIDAIKRCDDNGTIVLLIEISDNLQKIVDTLSDEFVKQHKLIELLDLIVA